MSLLSFTDEELDSRTALASALPPLARDGFLQFVAGKLAAYPPEARGPRLLHRLAEGQHRLLDRRRFRHGPLARASPICVS
jgi:hypothetical protein